MRPLTYCLLSTLLFGLPFSAFMSMLISYRRLWAVLSVVVICLMIFLASIITVISNAKKETLPSLFKTKRRWLIQLLGALVEAASFLFIKFLTSQWSIPLYKMNIEWLKLLDLDPESLLTTNVWLQKKRPSNFSCSAHPGRTKLKSTVSFLTSSNLRRKGHPHNYSFGFGRRSKCRRILSSKNSWSLFHGLLRRARWAA